MYSVGTIFLIVLMQRFLRGFWEPSLCSSAWSWAPVSRGSSATPIFKRLARQTVSGSRHPSPSAHHVSTSSPSS